MDSRIFGIILSFCFLFLTAGYFMQSQSKSSDEAIHYVETSKLMNQFRADLSADKYKNMEQSIIQQEQYKSIKLLQKDNEPINSNIDLVTPSFSIKIDGKKNMVVFSIGNHQDEDFEIPMLDLSSLSPKVYKITSEKKENVKYTPLLVSDIHSISQVIETISNTIQKEGIRVDTIFMDLRDNEWDVMKELVPRFCLMVRQYIIRTNSSVSPAFNNMKEMKDLYHQNGYTYSRIGNDPTVRVFIKE